MQVADQEIADEYTKMRAKQYNKHWLPITLISSFYLLIILVQYFTDRETPTIRIISSGINMAFCGLWIVMRRFAPTKVPIVAYLWLLNACILTNLSLRDLLPEVMLESEKLQDESKIFVSMILAHCTNYNKYMTVLVLHTLVILVATYFQYSCMADIWTDPYTGIAPTTDEEKSAFIQSRMINILAVLVGLTVHNYYIQRDLITTTIQNKML